MEGRRNKEKERGKTGGCTSELAMIPTLPSSSLKSVNGFLKRKEAQIH